MSTPAARALSLHYADGRSVANDGSLTISCLRTQSNVISDLESRSRLGTSLRFSTAWPPPPTSAVPG